MLKRYSVATDEMVELTQDYFDDLVKQTTALALDYRKNDPANFKLFYNNYALTNKVN